MKDTIAMFESLDLGFPGVEIGAEQSAIDTFVEHLPEYVRYASAQYILREKHALDKNSARYPPDEYIWELNGIEARAERDIPQFYYRHACVMLWTHFEWSGKRLLQYAAEHNPEQPPLGSKMHGLKAPTFSKQMRRYYQKEFGEPRILKEESWATLDHLNVIRSAIAHTNGALRGMTPKKRHSLDGAVENTPGVSIKHDALKLHMECIINWHTCVTESIQCFINYFARTHPGAAAFGRHET